MTNPRPPAKHKYSVIKLNEVMHLLGRKTFIAWQPNTAARRPSAVLQDVLRRRNAFDFQASEAAKTLLIDAWTWTKT